MRKILTGAIFFLIPLFALGLDVPCAAAQAGDAWALIAEVNAFRAAQGLRPFEVDSALMAAAQAHSEYQSEIGTVTHTGRGGSSALSRAIAAGFGDGASVRVIENIAGGNNLTPYQAVYGMWQDALHLETMLTSYYTHIGAGVAVSNNFVYFTIDVGVLVSAPGSATSTPVPGATPVPFATPAPTTVAARPVLAATPRPDGSIVHVVDVGQSLWTIAVVYEVPLEEILALNGLVKNSVIYPGDEIVIRPAKTPISTQTVIWTVTLEGSEGTAPAHAAAVTAMRPTRTPTLQIIATGVERYEGALVMPTGTASTALVDTPSPASPASSESGPDALLVAIIVLVFIGMSMVLMGGLLKRSA